MKENNIVIICGALTSGGAERVISILSKPFADTFKSVTLITWREAPIFYKLDSRINIISLKLLAESDNVIYKIFSLRQYIKRNRPDIVISFLTLFNMLTLISLFGLKIPVIVAERNDPRYIKGGIIVAFLRNLLYQSACGILCQTKIIRNCFHHKLRKKTKIIYNPINLTPEMVGRAVKTDKVNRIVSIGRLHPQKNQKLLFDSFKKFHQLHSDYILTLYGSGSLRADLESYINDIKMAEYIELAGERQDVVNLILDAKAFVLTSKYEGMPNALIEAMCVGLPCVSTKVSGATDLIKNGINGYLVNDNPDEISSKISTIIENNHIAKDMGIKSSKLYNKLNADYISKIWIKYIETTILDAGKSYSE